MIVNPHGLDIKWQVLLINLYCHVMVVDVRGPLSALDMPRGGAEPGEMKGGQNTPDVHRFCTLCPPPRFLVSLKALNQQQQMNPRALSAPLASAWAIKPRLFLVRRDQISLIFQLSLCWSRWRM